MSEAAIDWHVIKTARFKEAYVSRQLEESAEAETYLPMVKIPHRYLRRGQAQIEPLFPGYVFARFDLQRRLFELRRVHAFNALVCFDGKPAVVDPGIIADLRRRERGRGYLNLRPAAEQLRPQAPVRVVAGPFRGRTGLFVRYLSSAQRICILLDILKPQAVLELPLAAVEPESPAQATAIS